MTKYNIDEIVIDKKILNILSEDKEFENFFIFNFNKILNNSISFDAKLIVALCKNSNIEKVIFENLSEVLKKMTDRLFFISFMGTGRREFLKHSQDFFVEDMTGKGVNYYLIMIYLKNAGLSNEKILNLISENMENIIMYGMLGNIQGIMNDIKFYYKYSEKQIKKIDMALARNIEVILKKSKSIRYNFSCFDEMNMFKEEIKKKGIEFFINFSLDASFEEIKAISKELFGKFDEKAFAIMECGYDEKDFVIIETIAKELMKASNGNVTAEDITCVGRGWSSKAYQIGDYVLKIGEEREYNEIPNHRRILQPIIRTKIKYEGKNAFVEVQNVVDTKWHEDMTDEEVKNILFEIYADMRDKGIIWTDIKAENVGRLKRANKPNYTFIDIDGEIKDIRPTEIATGLIGEIDEKDILNEGDYVVLDTDYICTDESIIYYKEIDREFADRYEKLKAKRMEEKSSRII